MSSRVSSLCLNLICNSHHRTAQRSISSCPSYFIPNKHLIVIVTVYQFSNIKISHLLIYPISSLQKRSRMWKKPILECMHENDSHFNLHHASPHKHQHFLLFLVPTQTQSARSVVGLRTRTKTTLHLSYMKIR